MREAPEWVTIAEGNPLDRRSKTVRDDMSDNNDNGEESGLLPFDDGSAGRVIRRVWHDGR